MVNYKVDLKIKALGYPLAMAILPPSLAMRYTYERPNGEETAKLISLCSEKTATPVKEALEMIKEYFKKRVVKVYDYENQEQTLDVHGVQLCLSLHYDADVYQEVFSLNFTRGGKVEGKKEDISFLSDILLSETLGVGYSPVFTEDRASNIGPYSYLFAPLKDSK